MDEFGYLSVLIAIILGLAITQILLGYRGLLHMREHVRFYWPSLVWSGLILLMGPRHAADDRAWKARAGRPA